MSDLSRGAPAVSLLPESLDGRAVADFRAELLSRRGADLDLDGSQVVRLGAGCLQQILAAARSWSEDGRRLRVVRPSEALLSNLSTMGAVAAVPMLLEKADA
jgi:anti-anti-sigma regulatory factor